MATLVYRYGLLAPTLEADEVAAQMRAAHRYRNTLVEIERGRRTAIRTAEQDDPALTGVQAAAEYIDAELEQLARAAKARRADGRTRKLANEAREALREQRARAKQIRMAIRLYRAFVVIPGLQTERDRINTLAADLRRNARQHRPWGLRHKLVHGTYSLVESADEASRGKLPLYEDPQFRRWGDEGSVGVQIQGGLWAAALLACGDTRAQVSLGGSAPPCNVGRGTHKACVPGECRKPSTGTPTVSGRCGRGAREAAVLRLRVGSTDDRAPVWAEWPMRLDRPLPAGATVMQIAVHLRRTGPRDEWWATLTLRLPERERRRGDQIAVAVDVGWRALPDGSMRVAYWRGEDGRHDQLLLSAHQIAGLTKADGLRRQRDLNLELMRPWLRGRLRELGELPEWLLRMTVRRSERLPSSAQAIAHVEQWRSHARFAALWRRWAESRVVGDETAFAGLSWWRQRDLHLWDYEANQRRGAERQRLDHYRCFAKRLAADYGVCVLENFDKRQTRLTKRTEDGAETEDVALHHAQNLAAPSILCGALKNAFRRKGEVSEEPAAGTTLQCAADGCDGEIVGDAADDIVQRCSRGHVFDQDDNACRNLLARNRERARDVEGAGGARGATTAESEGRRAMSRRKSAERASRQEAARNAGSNAAE